MDESKDCDCVTHAGPHWLHVDLMDRAEITHLVEMAVETTDDAYRTELLRLIHEMEGRRLAAKLRNLEK